MNTKSRQGLYAVIDSIESFWVHTAHLPRKQRGKMKKWCAEKKLG